MAHAIKVRRSGIERIFRKTPFRQWLDEQDRNALTYKGALKGVNVAKGWTTEDFVRECWHRGIDVRIGTTFKWTSGSQPKPLALNALRREFPEIKF